MERILTVLQVVAPIFTAVILGIIARRRALLTREEIRGLQQFVVQFALPCVVFNSCLTAQMGAQALTSMAMVMPLLILGALWAFGRGKRSLPYHNLPMLFAAHETGMLGIPLTITLFGAAEAYRMGVLDLAQAVIAYPVIAILTSDAGENPSIGQIVKKVLTSPLVIMSGLGLVLNLSGGAAWMEHVGILGIVTESAGFLAAPISALMLFSVGYNFSMERRCRSAVLLICGVYLAFSAVFAVCSQAVLCLLPGVDLLTRWVLLLYAVLPASYLAPGLGRSEEDAAVASGVCSVLTVVSLLGFCVMAAAAV